MALSKGLRAPEDYNCLTKIIEDVNREVVSLKKESKALAVHTMNEVVNHVVMKLSDDETFKFVYKDTRRVGSYFDGLRVTEPTEFDVNVVLQFPFHRVCKVESSRPGYVRVRVKSVNEIKRDLGKKRGPNIRHIHPYLEQMVDIRGYVLRDKVVSWWQSIFAKAIQPMQEVTIHSVRYMVTWKMSGPAVTLHVKSLDSKLPELDIDIAPVMCFNHMTAHIPPTPVYQSRLATIPGIPREWYIVPKPIREGDTQRRWRLSFTDQDKVIMKGKEQLKPVNRLLKRLRDRNGWKALHSYMIKNVFLHETECQIYNQHNIGYLFIHALSVLKDYLKRKSIPYYWHERRNMLKFMHISTARNIAGCIENMLAKIHNLLNNPEELLKYVRSLFI